MQPNNGEVFSYYSNTRIWIRLLLFTGIVIDCLPLCLCQGRKILAKSSYKRRMAVCVQLMGLLQSFCMLQIIPGIGIIRFELQGLLILFDGFLYSARLSQCIAQVIMRFGVIGLEL